MPQDTPFGFSGRPKLLSFSFQASSTLPSFALSSSKGCTAAAIVASAITNRPFAATKPSTAITNRPFAATKPSTAIVRRLLPTVEERASLAATIRRQQAL